jgi:polar amino acid transport system substrate-binding protein
MDFLPFPKRPSSVNLQTRGGGAQAFCPETLSFVFLAAVAMRSLIPMLRSALLPLFCVFLAACSSSPDNVLRVGMELAYPPFEMQDTEGNPTGVSVDLARALGGYLGRPMEIHNIAFDGLIPSLKTGKIDLILSSLTITDERRQSVDFSDPYLSTGLAVLARRASDIQGMENLDRSGRRIAVKLGTTAHTWAQKRVHSAEVLVLDTDAACALEVSNGRIDAFVYDQLSVVKYWEKYPTTTRPLLRALQTESWGMAVRKGDAELLTQINLFLKQFRESGGFDRLADTYLRDARRMFREQGIPFYF